MTDSPEDRIYFQAIADRATGAWFFAMRSCEYLAVKQRGKTKCVMVGGVRFLDNQNRIIPHNSHRLWSDAVKVNITFTQQKNGLKGDQRTQARTEDTYLCPVRSWIRIIRELRNIPSSKDETPVSTYLDPKSGELRRISAENLIVMLRSTAEALGVDQVGYRPLEIGTHSIRSGCAMGLFMMDIHPIRIQIIGRWSSDAFMVYIRPQVLEWSSDLSIKLASLDHWTSEPLAADESRFEDHLGYTANRSANQAIIRQSSRPFLGPLPDTSAVGPPMNLAY